MRRNKHQARHAYVHPEEVPDEALVETRNVRIFVVRGEVIAPGHPVYKWLLEFELDFRTRLLERLRARKERLQEIIEMAFIDVSMLASKAVLPGQLASIMIDRARMANNMRPRARVVPQRIPIPVGSQLVRGLA